MEEKNMENIQNNRKMKLQNHLKVKIAALFFLILLMSQVLLQKSKETEIIPDEFPIEDINKELALLMQTRSAEPEKTEEGIKKICLLKISRRKHKKIYRAINFVAAAEIPVSLVKYESVFMGIDASESRIKLVDEAKKHLGLKYKYGGTTKKGFDCSGFTSYVMSMSGIGISRSSQYQSQQGLLTDIKSCQTGDLIFFSKYGKGGKVTHVAMVVDNNDSGIYVIHSTNRGIVIDNLSESSYWRPKVLYVRDMVSRA
jgi:hypothetical protein